MSSDIYSNPDLAHQVKAEDDGAEWRETCIYESAGAMEDYYTIPQPQEEEQQIESQLVVKKNTFRRATLCKGVMCIVVLSGLIILCIYFKTSQLQIHKQLTDEVKQLKDRIEVNNMQLQSRYDTLSQSYSLLKDEVNLKDKLEGKWCPEGWTRFGCSCYFRSTEKKSWFESKTYCQEKGAHLVIIDTEEEQNFVAVLNKNGESWIGLKVTGESTDRQQSIEWKWVDGSPLTKTFWESGSPSGSSSWLFATCCSDQGKWRQSYTGFKTWICEK